MLQEDMLGEMEGKYIVGRDAELDLLISLLSDSSPAKRLIHLYGTAGIGKSFLLDECARRARARHMLVFTLDGEHISAMPDALCSQLLHSMQPFGSGHAEADNEFERCVRVLNELAARQQVALMIDSYEQLQEVDQWMRDYLLKRLDSRIRIVISGRNLLGERWFLSPAWRSLIVRIPLAEISYEAVAQYAAYSQLEDHELLLSLWRLSKGHPLTMSLGAFLLQQAHERGSDLQLGQHDSLSYIVEQWQREVPGERLRQLIEAASIIRHFNQDSLSFVAGEAVEAADFQRLIRFSFVRKAEKGWTLHGLMREMLCQELMIRTPGRYELLRNRGLQYYCRLLNESANGSTARHEAFELMYYAGDALIRAFMDSFGVVPKRFEPSGLCSVGQLEAYVERRRQTATPAIIDLFDPHSDSQFRFEMSAEQTLLTLKSLDFPLFLELGYDVIRVLKDGEDRLIGLAVIIPINVKTLPYLMQSDRGKAYFASLPPAMISKLSVHESSRAGWFIETIDADDFGDAGQQSAIAHLLHSLIYTGELVVESPVPLPLFTEVHRSLGFEPVSGAEHTNYDGMTPTPTYSIQLQTEKLAGYIGRLMSRPLPHEPTEASWPPATEERQQESGLAALIRNRQELTEREKEVALLLEKGMKNNEIAAGLFISEATVKKHLKAMMEKLGATNRTQLLTKLLEQSFH